MKLPTREELLAAVLPVERVMRHKGRVATYRYASEDDATNHLKAEAAALKIRR